MLKKIDGKKQKRLKQIGIGSLIVAGLGIFATGLLTQLGQDLYGKLKGLAVKDSTNISQQEPPPIEWLLAVEEEILYYTVKLATYPFKLSDGSEILSALEPVIGKLREFPAYEEMYPVEAAMLWKTVGGAYLINNKLRDVPTRIRAALPFLKRSLELDADQLELREAIGFLESAREEGHFDPEEYLRVNLGIIRGDDPDNEEIIAVMISELMSAEWRAERWLLWEATQNQISLHLEALKLRLKKERNIDAEIEISTRRLENGLFEVRVQIGPNIFLWHVDLENKQYSSENEFTADYMRVFVEAESSTLP
jgi:hypothetical protein